MKKYLLLIFSAALIFCGCSYDDDDIWKKVNELDNRVEQLESLVESMNSQVISLQKIVAAVNESSFVTEVKKTDDGYQLIMSNGDPIVIYHGTNGSNGSDAPVIGVKSDNDGIYYWTIKYPGEQEPGWLKTPTGEKLPVSGTAPVVGVDKDGNWTIDGTPLEDANGKRVKAVGADGADGDSFFKDVDITDPSKVVLTLLDDTVIEIPRSDSRLIFTNQFEGKLAVVNFGKSKEITLDAANIEMADVLSLPQGWNASIDIRNQKVVLTAPAAGGTEEGIVTIVGMDKKGNTLMAYQKLLAVPDYTDPQGTFLLNEGSLFSQNGTIIWYDGLNNAYTHIYEKANDNHEIGNVLQDMFIVDGKAYLVCQKGSALGGDGQLIVCDAATMQSIAIYDNLDFNRYPGSPGFPQHIVVADNKVFIQYVDNDLESNSGIRVFDLEDEVLRNDDIEGTYGAFGTVGALKGRMLYSKGKIIAGLAKGFVIIDPVLETVTKTVTFSGGVKDIVKGADGNLHIAVTGDFTTPQDYYDESPQGSKMYVYSQSGDFISMTELTEVTFTTSTGYPNIGMAASFNDPYLYFIPEDDWMYMDYIGRWDYSTKTLIKEYVQPQAWNTVYGYCGEHPFRKELYVGLSVNYMWTRAVSYDLNAPLSPHKGMDYSYNGYTASPSGFYFTYCFSDEFINR